MIRGGFGVDSMVKGGLKRVSIRIPFDLYAKIEEKIAGTSFSSVEEYVVSKLESDFPAEPVYSKEEEERIKERLRKLGYIE